ncbi:MAG: TRAM domain-containing protein, partial [Paludibacteraceae bacterium]|nr:TRAM domain-containing protein [Paludibacteraceae bacterium]
YVGRTEFDSPDVDGEVLIVKNKNLEIGNFYQVKITDSDMYDLYGEVL